MYSKRGEIFNLSSFFIVVSRPEIMLTQCEVMKGLSKDKIGMCAWKATPFHLICMLFRGLKAEKYASMENGGSMITSQCSSYRFVD